MIIPSKLFSGADSTVRDGLHSGAGALTGTRTADHDERPVTNTPATDEWVNEGGADTATGAGATLEESPPPLPRSARRATGDTPEWCRERAALDLVAAGEMDTANGRLRFEHSAVSWTARADLLQRLKDSFEAKRIAAAAIWPVGAPSASRRRIFDRKEPQHVRI